MEDYFKDYYNDEYKLYHGYKIKTKRKRKKKED